MNLKYTSVNYLHTINFLEGRKIDLPPLNNNLEDKVERLISSVLVKAEHEKGFQTPLKLSKLIEILKFANKEGYISNAIIHGSFGDNTYTKFSDIELTLIIQNSILSNYNQKVKFHRWLKQDLYPEILKIDPLQHHGVFYLWNDLISDYNQDILPLKAYNKCWGINSELILFNLNSKYENRAKIKLKSTLNSLSNYEKVFFSRGRSLYAIKRLISNIALVPAFSFQMQGEYISKEEALQVFKNSEVKSVTELLRIITELRNDWPSSPNWLGTARGILRPSSLPNGRKDLLLANLYRKPKFEKLAVDQISVHLKGFCMYVQEEFIKNE